MNVHDERLRTPSLLKLDVSPEIVRPLMFTVVPPVTANEPLAQLMVSEPLPGPMIHTFVPSP